MELVEADFVDVVELVEVVGVVDVVEVELLEDDGAVVVVVEVAGVTVPPVSCCTCWRSDSMLLIVGLVGAQVAGLQVGQGLLVG